MRKNQDVSFSFHLSNYRDRDARFCAWVGICENWCDRALHSPSASLSFPEFDEPSIRLIKSPYQDLFPGLSTYFRKVPFFYFVLFLFSILADHNLTWADMLIMAIALRNFGIWPGLKNSWRF